MAELLADFMARETEPRPQIIGRGILPRCGKMVLGGPPKANKSYVALNIALDVARGRQVFNAAYTNGTPVMPVGNPHSVLYIEQEIGEGGLRERLAALIPQGYPPCEFYIKSRDMAMRMDTPEGRARISQEIAQVRPDVTILDPLAKFHLSDENSAQEMGAIMRVGDHWIEDYGTAIIYIHHTGLAAYNPENHRRGGARLRGSSAIFADVDTYMEVERKSASHHKEPIIELNLELRLGEPIEPIWVRRLQNGSVMYLGESFQWGHSVREGAGRKPAYEGL